MRQETYDRTQLERAEAEDAKWQSWLSELERIMGEWQAAWGNLPYKLPLRESTGLDCWREYYDDEYTPERTFYDDQSAWV